MPIDRSITRASPDDELVLYLTDPDYAYTADQVCDLLDQAEALGFDLPELREIQTVRQLEILVTRRQ